MSSSDCDTPWICGIAVYAKLRAPTGNVCLAVRIPPMRASLFASRSSRPQFRRPRFAVLVFLNREDQFRNPAPKARCRASRTSTLLFVDLFLTEQIRNREPFGWSIELGDKFLKALRKKIVPETVVKFQTRRSEIVFVKVAPAAPDRFLHQSINIMKMNS